jgi:hypothetical protein
VELPTGVTVLRPADYRRMRWKNGGGWTTEIAAHPAGADEFAWRVSVAEVEVDGDFSRFPGVDRSILVLAGAGMTLAVDGAPEALLRAGGEALAFPGDVPARCRLVAGPTRDLNVMTRRAALRHALTRGGPGAHPLARDASTRLVHVVAGAAAVAGVRLAAGDTLRVDPGPGAALELRADGELALVRIDPA